MKGIKIWCSEKDNRDIYVDFKSKFTVLDKEKIYINLSCDSNFSICVNGKIAGFGACQNYLDNKQYYKFDITKFCNKENELKILVWHIGVDNQTYINQPPFLMFEVYSDSKVYLRSSKEVLCKVNNNYKKNYCKLLTLQLGFSYLYDNTVVDENNYVNSTEFGEDYAWHNGINNLSLLGRIKPKVIKTEDGYIFDMKKETVGFIDLDFTCKKDEKIVIAYGEHLRNGNVVRLIHPRDFSVEFIAKKGNNKFLNLTRRIGGRYLQIYTKDVKVNYLGIRPVDYPIENKKVKFNNKLYKKIYDTSVYTLKCCMHEHYEDCPWREQGLYTMDSRNQMLCGYYAFNSTDYQKANIKLMSNGLRKDGLLSICFPAGVDIPIPSFSLIYLKQVYEYIEYTNDKTVLDEKVIKACNSIIETFTKKIDKNNLIANFPYPYWNFYEWNDVSANDWEITRTKDEPFTLQYDLLLNCMYVYAVGYYDKIFGTNTDVSKIKQAIKETFYDEKRGVYKLSTIEDRSSILGNSLAILIGLGDKALADKLVNNINDFEFITLSMNTFFYDALLSVGDDYKDFILDNMLSKYKKMLDAGATTFWETEKGAEDFGGVGSMCHGWSAMPVYYLNKLGLVK